MDIASFFINILWAAIGFVFGSAFMAYFLARAQQNTRDTYLRSQAPQPIPSELSPLTAPLLTVKHKALNNAAMKYPNLMLGIARDNAQVIVGDVSSPIVTLPS